MDRCGLHAGPGAGSLVGAEGPGETMSVASSKERMGAIEGWREVESILDRLQKLTGERIRGMPTDPRQCNCLTMSALSVNQAPSGLVPGSGSQRVIVGPFTPSESPRVAGAGKACSGGGLQSRDAVALAELDPGIQWIVHPFR